MVLHKLHNMAARRPGFRLGFLILLWLLAGAATIAITYWMRWIPPDRPWIQRYTRGWIEYPFIAVWLAPLGPWFFAIAAWCLWRSGRSTPWRWLLLVGWALPWGLWGAILVQASQPMDTWLYRLGIRLPTGDPLLARIDTHVLLGLTASAAISTLVLGLITRSWPVTLAALAALPFAAGWSVLGQWAAPAWFWMVCGALLWWSTRILVQPGHCPHCRYDLRALPTGSPCPECGARSLPPRE